MPLPVADKGMALFPQPQLLQDYANAGLQKLNAARWIRFNPRCLPRTAGRIPPVGIFFLLFNSACNCGTRSKTN